MIVSDRSLVFPRTAPPLPPSELIIGLLMRELLTNDICKDRKD